MSVYWGGSYNSLRRPGFTSTAVARLLDRFRHRSGYRVRAGSLEGGRRGPVVLSELADALDALRSLPFAAPSETSQGSGAALIAVGDSSSSVGRASCPPAAFASETVRAAADADRCHPDAGGLRAFTRDGRRFL